MVQFQVQQTRTKRELLPRAQHILPEMMSCVHGSSTCEEGAACDLLACEMDALQSCISKEKDKVRTM